jgi:hypothetical protein
MIIQMGFLGTDCGEEKALVITIGESRWVPDMLVEKEGKGKRIWVLDIVSIIMILENLLFL